MEYQKIIVMWKADRAILNSVFDLPPDRNTISFPLKDEDNVNNSKITTRSKITIFDGKIVLLFDDNKVAIKQYDKIKINEDSIIYYLIYKTFLYYNCLMPENENEESASEVDKVIFQLHRYVTKYAVEDGHTIPYPDTEPCEIVLNKKEIVDYLTILDPTILYAISYYIRGCNTQQYFLVEFYKCLEIIKNHFGNEKKMKESLKNYGFLEDTYKETKKIANDTMKPLSVSRHAPAKDVSVHNIDTKWLFSDPIGRKVFDTGEKACRNIIDAYLQFRIANNS
ncbi:MAG TPA: hypothetical protein DDW84_06880 [Phycisphaerales bacterium]|nr:MAG: hypothetical protein A2Y13_03590 [Planctomycetes bacterium GWC2_45_44]HBG78547.1 hypothetical protein [Phycisphaerales bacterium]HBR20895.1 hypothetical protein [Phycisphaerales bacterium]